MKFRELFNEDWTVNWESIFKLSHFAKLESTQQSSVWHKEGNVWNHTKLVTDEMQDILLHHIVEKGSEDWVMCMAAAICHDLGKGETTVWSDEKHDWTTKNHGIVGERIVRHLFNDEDIILREKVCYMVRHHMALHHIFDKGKDSNSVLIKLSHGIVPVKYMMMLNEADSRGSINDIEDENEIRNRYYDILGKSYALHCLMKPYSFIEKSSLIRKFINYEGDVVNKANDFCVYILVGFPGCGKSTYVDSHLSEKKVISRDVIRGELGIGGATTDNDKKVVGTKEEEDKVSEIFDNLMFECCENKESFVLDNTNLKYQYRKDYLLKIMKYNPKVKIIYIEAPNFIKECVNRRKGEIKRSVYDRMEDTFDFPQLSECDELVIVKQQNDGSEKTYSFNGDLKLSQDYLTISRIIDDLKTVRGKMILDGCKCNDECVKYMDILISNYVAIDKLF